MSESGFTLFSLFLYPKRRGYIMWTSYKILNRIEESIAGWSLGNQPKSLPHYVRANNNEIEYTNTDIMVG